MSQEIYAHIRAATELIVAEMREDVPDGKSLEERVHSRMWAYVTHACKEVRPSSIEATAPKRDKRTKPWQYVVRFWNITPIGQDLVAETDPEVMQGTGNLPAIVSRYGLEMHTPENADPNFAHEWLPTALSEESVKEKLEQLRNNLGRQGSAVLRIPYNVGDESYLCQVDITSLNA